MYEGNTVATPINWGAVTTEPKGEARLETINRATRQLSVKKEAKKVTSKAFTEMKI